MTIQEIILMNILSDIAAGSIIAILSALAIVVMRKQKKSKNYAQ